MSALDLLLNEYWIIKKDSKEDYFNVKKSINNKDTLKFIQELLGWKIIHTEQLIKLEKIPAHAEPFMGIQEFKEPKDYCFLCAILMFLEDKDENSQFLLSDLIHYIETVIASYMEVDWTKFNERKSLVRVLQFAEEIGMLKAYEGDSSLYSKEQNSEVLYENTGVSRFFATNFPMDISSKKTWQDFEEKQVEELDEDKGNLRINRVFRQLVVCPSMYWSDNSDPSAVYLKNKKNYVSANIEKNMGGLLQISHNNASVVFTNTTQIGDIHPKNSMLSEIVLLVSHTIYNNAKDARKLTKQSDDTIHIPKNKFKDLILQIKEKYQELWSKEYREITDEKCIFQVTEYMKKWLMIKEKEDEIILMPSCVFVSGTYSKYMEEKINDAK